MHKTLGKDPRNYFPHQEINTETLTIEVDRRRLYLSFPNIWATIPGALQRGRKQRE